MRIQTIELTWFRGAAELAVLAPHGKSLLVYGENGSGKSSFVDAVELVLSHGKIGHLAHEYSGRRQEKAILNTHMPPGGRARVRIAFADNSDVITEIPPSGTVTTKGTAATRMNAWDYRRTVLRQHEVADFIHETKGQKYSALLPLLGLDRLEIAAENLHRLARTIDQQREVVEARQRLETIKYNRTKTLGAISDAQLGARIQELHETYCPGDAAMDPGVRCRAIGAAIDSRTMQFSEDERRRIALHDAGSLSLTADVAGVRSANAALAGKVEPRIGERLEVLRAAGAFSDRLDGSGDVPCPSCGRLIAVDTFRAHVNAERSRLQEVLAAFADLRRAVDGLCATLRETKSVFGKPELKAWRDTAIPGALGGCLAALEGLDISPLRDACGEDALCGLEACIVPLVDAARAAESAVPDLPQLLADKGVAENALAALTIAGAQASVDRATALLRFVEALEQGVREEIRLRSQTVIDEISEDVRTMWSVLHPGEAIEGVCLALPAGADKAIDIHLKFHGVDQDSPRLTLSEGHRNSLGLCIFLAMAKREAATDRPLFLDDVVVSVDRNHRGMIVELLESQFSKRQVILFTHDRDWYTDLRHQLDAASWKSIALMPYETPEMGIRLSQRTSTFDDARAQLQSAPDAAGNTARKIMDVEFAVRCERLKTRLPYLHREKNDHRTVQDFLPRLIADGERCFKVRSDGPYVPNAAAIDAFRAASKLLVTWGNRASHSSDVVRNEAGKLIGACEVALEAFECPDCRKQVCRLDDGAAEFVQCHCGRLRWLYGKA